MPKVKANGIEIYYELHGKGEPLVLILGFTMNHFAWAPILDELAKHFQVILFDNRGAGETEAIDEPYTIELMAKDTLALLDELNIEKAFVLGQSMGSCICQEIAKLAPERIQKMILCGTFSKRKMTTSYAFESFGKLLEEGLATDRVVELFFPFIFSDDFLSDTKTMEEIKKRIKQDPCPMNLIGYKRQGEALQKFNSSSFLSKLTVPTLVIGYEKDLCSFLDEAEFVASEIPNAKFEVLAGVGHAGFTEKPQEFLNFVFEFLKKSP